MISEIRLQNFKSIQDLTLKPGRVTVLIGANGSGKSNILEAIAFAAGAAANKLDNEFLFNRGIRVTEDTWMRSAFPTEQVGTVIIDPPTVPIQFAFRGNAGKENFECLVSPQYLTEDQKPAGWTIHAPVSTKDAEEALREKDFAEEIQSTVEKFKAQFIQNYKEKTPSPPTLAVAEELAWVIRETLLDRRVSQRKAGDFSAIGERLGLLDYMIYSPENTVLRTPPPEGAILPLGARGEGLFKLLQSFSNPKLDRELAARIDDLKDRLHLFGWFEDMLAPDDAATAQARLQLRDRWLAENRAVFDQRSANEGFLYVLFYFTLLMSWRTPKFFAVDNLDNALNPKLCAMLMQQITELARTYGKQVICTVHNPAILDGLDLTQDDQRLFTVRRNAEGHTVVRRVHAPQPQPGETPVRLSEAFTRGIIGGLPNNF